VRQDDDNETSFSDDKGLGGALKRMRYFIVTYTHDIWRTSRSHPQRMGAGEEVEAGSRGEKGSTGRFDIQAQVQAYIVALLGPDLHSDQCLLTS